MPNERSATLFRNVLIRGADFAIAESERWGLAIKAARGPLGPVYLVSIQKRRYKSSQSQICEMFARNMDAPSKALSGNM